jgi:hypothetical protein
MEISSDVSSMFFTLCAFNSFPLLHSLFPITIFIIPFELKEKEKDEEKTT